jgi:hypothetical protein
MNTGHSKAPYVITKYDIAATIVEESPLAAEYLADFGLACTSCFFSDKDTLEIGAKIHGMTDAEVDDMVREINDQLEIEWKKENHE